MMELRSQIIATIEQDLSNALYTVGQVIAQEESAVEQQVDRFLGINPSAQNPSPNIAVTQPGSEWGAGRGNAPASGSGSGSSAATTAHNQPTNTIKQPNGSGSGGRQQRDNIDPRQCFSEWVVEDAADDQRRRLGRRRRP